MSEPTPAAQAALVRGRFAPSPTGPLHFGSLVAAVASWLDARSRGGEWLLRIEDLDPPREVRGAANDILGTLEAFGLHWDGPVRYQSRCTQLYAAVLQRLVENGVAYPCACTRRQIAAAARMGIDGPVYPGLCRNGPVYPGLCRNGPVYPGLCRNGLPPGRSARAWRLRVPPGAIVLHDECFGEIAQDVEREVGDFVLRRADGWFAYQLAVVVDDADQGVNRVVRGADLIDSSQRQMLLQHLLDLPSPAYLHVAAAVDARGDKLSKQTRARPLERSKASAALFAALEFLHQAPPAELAQAPAEVILEWARRHWRPDAIPPVRSLPAPALWY